MCFLYFISYTTALLTLTPIIMRFQPYTGDTIGPIPAEFSVKDTHYAISLLLGMGISIPFLVEILFQLLSRLMKGVVIMDSDIFLRWSVVCFCDVYILSLLNSLYFFIISIVIFSVRFYCLVHSYM